MDIQACLVKLGYKAVVWDNSYKGIKPHELETRPIPTIEELEAVWTEVKAEKEKEEYNAPILARLAEIDAKTIRCLRDGEPDWIKKYKEEADIERAKIKK